MLLMTSTTNKKIDPQAQKFAENWLPVRGIQNGEIILENGLRVTGVKVRPRNIFILDYDSQSNAIFNLRNFYNTMDYEFSQKDSKLSGLKVEKVLYSDIYEEGLVDRLEKEIKQLEDYYKELDKETKVD